MHKHRLFSRPWLEQLEARDCPSCTVFQRGETLYILGDRAANQIDIAPAREGGINVICDVGDPHRFTGVKKIDLRTFGGDDSVNYVCPSDPSLHFRADLGSGNDRMSISGFDPQPDPPRVALYFDLHGGAGHDTFDLDMMIPPDQQRQEVEWDMRLDLGAWHDRLNVEVQIPPDQQLEDVTWDMNVAMGAGNDHYDLKVATPPDQQRLEGLWDMRTDLGAGDDTFMMNMGEVELAGEFMMLVEGSAGDDLFDSSITPCILPSAHVSFAFNGGSGQDQFMMNVAEGEISGEFMMSVDGGAGHDRMNAFIVPCLLPTGRAEFVFSGQGGNDLIDIEIQQDGDDAGALDVRVFGGLGNDNLKLALYDIPEAVLLHALLDGGQGYDLGHLTRNVRFANCEELFFLDDPR